VAPPTAPEPGSPTVEPGPGPDAGPEPDATAGPDPGPGPEPDPESDPGPGPEPDPGPGPEPDATAGPDDATEAVFAALADGTRRGLLRAIAAVASTAGTATAPAAGGGGTTATALAEGLPVSRQAVVKHLQALEAAGLVASERHGRERRYRVVAGPLDEAVRWMVEVGAAWDDRLDRLRHRVEGR